MYPEVTYLQNVLTPLIDYPDEMEIERTMDEKGVLLRLTVNPADLGRVIGRGGDTALATRKLLRTLGVRNNARYNLKIVDVDKELTD